MRVCQQLFGRQGNWISFVQHFVFPRRQKRRKNERRAQLQKRHGLFGEIWAWCEQTMINTVPSPQTPIFLDVILGTYNRFALYRSHTCAGMRKRAGWKGAAVVFSQCLCSSDTQAQSLFTPSHLPHSTAGSHKASGRWELHWKHAGNLLQSAGLHVCMDIAHGLCVSFRGDGGLMVSQHFSEVLYWCKPCQGYWRSRKEKRLRLSTYLWCWRPRCQCESRYRW